MIWSYLGVSGDGANKRVVYRLVGKDAATLHDNSQSARWHSDCHALS